jgi:hypothetical protein
MKPYYADSTVTLYLGDCRDATEWLDADVLVTDPPYGRAWRQGRSRRGRCADDSHPGIAGDKDTTTRDDAIRLWGAARCAVVFGDLLLSAPAGTKQVCVYRKPVDTGTKGAMGGFRRDVEAVFLVGPWPAGLNGRSSVLATGATLQGTASGMAGRYGHPHAKPVDVMETLIAHCPPGVIADPFAGGGSTLIAARNQGRRAVGVEIDERFCEAIAKRLSADVLPLDVTA